MNATTYGLDIAKRVFQLYWVDTQTGEIANRKFGRDDLITFLAQRPAGRIALEACGSAHWWARKIRALGHEVVLLHAQFIRPFVQTNKTDAADARAIWTAVQQPGMRTLAAKTEDQQVMLSLHRMRSLLVKFRTMQINQLRGFGLRSVWQMALRSSGTLAHRKAESSVRCWPICFCTMCSTNGCAATIRACRSNVMPMM